MNSLLKCEHRYSFAVTDCTEELILKSIQLPIRQTYKILCILYNSRKNIPYIKIRKMSLKSIKHWRWRHHRKKSHRSIRSDVLNLVLHNMFMYVKIKIDLTKFENINYNFFKVYFVIAIWFFFNGKIFQNFFQRFFFLILYRHGSLA